MIIDVILIKQQLNVLQSDLIHNLEVREDKIILILTLHQKHILIKC